MKKALAVRPGPCSICRCSRTTFPPSWPSVSPAAPTAEALATAPRKGILHGRHQVRSQRRAASTNSRRKTAPRSSPAASVGRPLASGCQQRMDSKRGGARTQGSPGQGTGAAKTSLGLVFTENQQTRPDSKTSPGLSSSILPAQLLLASHCVGAGARELFLPHPWHSSGALEKTGKSRDWGQEGNERGTLGVSGSSPSICQVHLFAEDPRRSRAPDGSTGGKTFPTAFPTWIAGSLT